MRGGDQEGVLNGHSNLFVVVAKATRVLPPLPQIFPPGGGSVTPPMFT